MGFHIAILALSALVSPQKQPTVMMTVNVQAHINYMGTVYQAGDFSNLLRNKDVKTVVVPNEKTLADDKAIDKAGGSEKFLKKLVAMVTVPTSSVKAGTKKTVKSVDGAPITFERKGDSVTVNGQLVASTVTCSDGIVYFLK